MATEKVSYETIIRVVKGEDVATVRTSNRKLKNRLHSYDLEPVDESGTTETYEEVPTSWLRIQRPRQFTEEELEETRERLSKALGRDKKKGKGKKATAKPAKPAKPDPDEDDEVDDDEEETPKKGKKGAAAKPAAKGKAKPKPADDDDEELDDDPDAEDESDDDEDDEPVEIVKRKKKK